MHCGLGSQCPAHSCDAVLCKLWSGIVAEYQVPFYNCVGSDPSFDEMRRVVCIERRRPDIPNRWNNSEVIILCCLYFTASSVQDAFGFIYFLQYVHIYPSNQLAPFFPDLRFKFLKPFLTVIFPVSIYLASSPYASLIILSLFCSPCLSLSLPTNIPKPILTPYLSIGQTKHVSALNLSCQV